MKVVVIGCTHAGTAAVKTLANVNKNIDITVYEKNNNVSFLSCGIALYVGGVAKDASQLFYSSPEELKALGATMHMEHEVLEIDTENKQVRVKDLQTGEEKIDPYDKLVMTTGSWPIIPPIDGINLDNILLSKNYNQANEIIERSKNVRNVTVIGAGYIGVELVEAFALNGKNVTLIDSEDRILNKYLDKEFTDVVEAEFAERNIHLALQQTVTKFAGDERGKVTKVYTTKGEYETDLVILCVGFRPNTNLLKGKVDLLPNGAIKINEYMQSSNPDIYAAGDSCAVNYNPTGEKMYIPLATNAVRMGTLVGYNIAGRPLKYMGTQGTSGLHIFGLNMASTGLTEVTAKLNNIPYEVTEVIDNDRPEFMPTFHEIRLKVLFHQETREILGAQLISKADVTQMMNTLSVCIQTKMTIDELGFIDFFFQPHFNKPWNTLNQAGLAAIAKQKELVKQ
ncbi:NADH oxidase [Niallia circulans]|jgi:NADPH-dependent 2,4-dienoyl-CoA reductase/sulfur reductase-like enzyme|uniref:NADH oxidase n=1 Tax=Niallia circulans TaxID=1397 RepID=A0A0J1INI1_NIACI|nr:FAD-dependent oxidoreductase [Niallia circulans]KLV27521.1 NADH oxidase [Niallia circulans]MCM2981291.1 FAD-dependent oxidoreductase [Niallia circulans]MDR4316839.1 NADH oxidase [Niallia circulans]MED3840167.1 FAD-dependent oxidoreductase [Niallia circulans]MED4241855.1 FAD-dependent oxidoreductase [Niallia circulans]